MKYLSTSGNCQIVGTVSQRSGDSCVKLSITDSLTHSTCTLSTITHLRPYSIIWCTFIRDMLVYYSCNAFVYILLRFTIDCVHIAVVIVLLWFSNYMYMYICQCLPVVWPMTFLSLADILIIVLLFIIPFSNLLLKFIMFERCLLRRCMSYVLNDSYTNATVKVDSSS